MNCNIVYYKSSENMQEVDDESIDLIITSPPYFNIKNYHQDGYQINTHSNAQSDDIGNINSYNKYIKKMLLVWEECYRVLRPNGKLCINVPLMPMVKKIFSTHENRHIFDLQSDIQHSIINNTKLFLMDVYVWNRINSNKKLMFGSYPYPNNFYAQNTCEFITVYVKGGLNKKNRSDFQKKNSILSQEEWVSFTKQIWDIPMPNKSDIAYGIHPSIMPEEIVYRLTRLYSFVDDIILDVFCGSGTTLKVAQENNRNYIGYEIYNSYKNIIDKKLLTKEQLTISF